MFSERIGLPAQISFLVSSAIENWSVVAQVCSSSRNATVLSAIMPTFITILEIFREQRKELLAGSTYRHLVVSATFDCSIRTSFKDTSKKQRNTT